MVLYTLLVTVYVLIAAFALYMTHQEMRRRTTSGRLHVLSIYALCLVWPVMVALVSIGVFLSGNQPNHQPSA
jgi:multisubunit Na+/H+ antiporter MnhE subunit